MRPRASGLACLAATLGLLLGCAPDRVAVIQTSPPVAGPAVPALAAPTPPLAAAPAAPAAVPPRPRAAVPAIPASRRFVALVGERLQHDPPFLDVPHTNYFCLRSLLDRQTGQAIHQLYVSDSYYGAEKFWETARDGEGHPLRFLSVGRHEISCDHGCSYIEDFAADIPESELRAHPQGLAVVFTGRTGATKRIDIPPAMIATQLTDFDAARRKLMSATVPVAQ